MELRFDNGSSLSLPSTKRYQLTPRLETLIDASQKQPLEFRARNFTMDSFLGFDGTRVDPKKNSPNNNAVLEFNNQVRIYIQKGNCISVSEHGTQTNIQYRLKIDCDEPYSVKDFENLLIVFKNTDTKEKRLFKFSDMNHPEYNAMIYLNPGEYQVSLLPNLNFGDKKTKLSQSLSSSCDLLKMQDISIEDQIQARKLLHAIVA